MFQLTSSPLRVLDYRPVSDGAAYSNRRSGYQVFCTEPGKPAGAHESIVRVACGQTEEFLCSSSSLIGVSGHDERKDTSRLCSDPRRFGYVKSIRNQGGAWGQFVITPNETRSCRSLHCWCTVAALAMPAVDVQAQF